jgi:hypothetical protein
VGFIPSEAAFSHLCPHFPQETAASAAKQKLGKLQEDFKYNLKLLEGRDEELALYDANFASLKNVLRDREAELSEI